MATSTDEAHKGIAHTYQVSRIMRESHAFASISHALKHGINQHPELGGGAGGTAAHWRVRLN